MPSPSQQLLWLATITWCAPCSNDGSSTRRTNIDLLKAKFSINYNQSSSHYLSLARCSHTTVQFVRILLVVAAPSLLFSIYSKRYLCCELGKQKFNPRSACTTTVNTHIHSHLTHTEIAQERCVQSRKRAISTHSNETKSLCNLCNGQRKRRDRKWRAEEEKDDDEALINE